MAIVSSIPYTGEFPLNSLFTISREVVCSGCLLPLSSMSQTLRRSSHDDLCARCYDRSLRGSLLDAETGDAPKARAVRYGLVTTAIKKQNAPTGTNVLKRFVSQIIVLRRDVEVKRVLAHSAARVTDRINTVRKEISEFSKKSLARMVRTARNLPDLSIMITLTYPGQDWTTNGREVKYHLQRFRQWLRYQGVSGFWFLEFQKRGAPHFHLYIDKYVDHLKVSRYWYNIVGSGQASHLAAGCRVESLRELHALAAYAQKYAAKAEQKEVPADFVSVGRFWGKFGDIAIQERLIVAGDLGSTRPAVNEQTGEILPSDAVNLAPAVRVVARLYKNRRESLIKAGAKVRPVSPRMTGWGSRSFTAWDIADSALSALSRLGVSGVCTS